ncbi:protein bax [Affinibrenneria salicis]|nr:protein bax [Affinibrenneria salicis]
MRTVCGFAFLIVLLAAPAWASSDRRTAAADEEYSRNNVQQHLPDLRKYPSGTPRKKAFLQAVVPVITQQNQIIRQERDWLLNKRHSATWAAADAQRLQQICSRYRVSCGANAKQVNWDALLKRVNTLPVHLVATQAATESGWGTSKLAQQNNNLFGLRCAHRRCGQRNAQSGYQSYGSIVESVRDYMLNMNTHGAYQSLRESRERQRDSNEADKARHLINDLDNYSQRGETYNRYLHTILDHNEHLISQIQRTTTTAVDAI